jgi:ParB family chromosome partitioning protein
MITPPLQLPLFSEITEEANSPLSNEWYTPPQYIEAAREVMGAIDCDPASCDIAQKRVKASIYYTVVQNGLQQTWGKRVWMNPPYSKGLIDKFCEALVRKYQSGEVVEACLLANNGTDTGWAHILFDLCQCVCFVKGRISFLDAQGQPQDGNNRAQMFFYLGPHPERFAAVFSQFGKVLYP